MQPNKGHPLPFWAGPWQQKNYFTIGGPGGLKLCQCLPLIYNDDTSILISSSLSSIFGVASPSFSLLSLIPHVSEIPYER